MDERQENSFKGAIASSISQCYNKEPLALKLLEGICSVNSLLGLDFVAEIQNDGAISISHCKYWCGLCSKKLIGYSLVSHLSSSSHKHMFIGKVFPSLLEKFTDFDKMTSDEKRFFDTYVEKIIEIVGIKAMAVVCKSEESFIINFFKRKIDFINKLSYFDSIIPGKIDADTNGYSTPAVKDNSNTPVDSMEVDSSSQSLNGTKEIENEDSLDTPIGLNSYDGNKSTGRWMFEGRKSVYKKGRSASPIDSKLDSKRYKMEDSNSQLNDVSDEMKDVVLEDDEEEEDEVVNRFKPGQKITLKCGELCAVLDLMALPNGTFLVNVETKEGNNVWIESKELDDVVPYKSNDFRCENYEPKKAKEIPKWDDVSDLIEKMKPCQVLKPKFAASSAKARAQIPVGRSKSLNVWDVFKDEDGVATIRGKTIRSDTLHYAINIHEFCTESKGGLTIWRKGKRRFNPDKKYPIDFLGRIMTLVNVTDTLSFSKEHPVKIELSSNLRSIFEICLQDLTIKKDIVLDNLNLFTSFRRSSNLSNFLRFLEYKDKMGLKAEEVTDSVKYMSDKELESSVLAKRFPSESYMEEDVRCREELKITLSSLSLTTHLLTKFSCDQSLFPFMSNEQYERKHVCSNLSVQATLYLIKQLETEFFMLLLENLHQNRRNALKFCLKETLPKYLKERLYNGLLLTNPMCLDVWDEVVKKTINWKKAE